MIREFIRNKNVLFAFSDPAGAKSVLSFAKYNRTLANSIITVSDRQHGFYSDFGFIVETYGNKTTEEWLRESGAQVLVTGTSFPLNLEVDLIGEASKLGIISLAITDHWVNFKKRFETADSLVLPTWICVIDERARQLAIAEGLPPEKIMVTGNPYHEFMSTWKPKIYRDEFLSSIGLSLDTKYVLYAPEPISTFGLQEIYGFTELDGIQMICEAMHPISSEKVCIIIKGHANQTDEVFEEFISQGSNCRMIYSKSLDLNTCIFFSECVIGFFSNSLIEANLLGKSIIRPLMKMSDSFVDPIKEMESSEFHSFSEKIKFIVALQNCVS